MAQMVNITVFSIVLHDFIHIVFTVFSVLLYNTLIFKCIQNILKSFYIALLYTLCLLQM